MTEWASCCQRGVLALGPIDAKVAIVGIAPGAKEIELNKPFQGQSGLVLNALLQSVGLRREDVLTTNVHCQFNNKPGRTELDACRPRLLEELEQTKIIVPMGAIATAEFTDIPFGKSRGAVLYDAVPDKIVLPTYHPSGILQAGDKPDVQNQMAADLCRDFETLALLLANKTKQPPILDNGYTIITDSKRAQEILDSIEPDTLVTLDIETDYEKETDESIFDQHILCIGVGFNQHIYVLADGGLSVQWPDNVRYCYHNGQFDTIGLWLKYGRRFEINEDTMIQSYTLDERNRPGLHKLKNLSRQYAGSDFYEETEHKDQGAALYEYNAKDIANTAYLVNFFRPMQEEQQVRELYENLLIPGANMLAEAQYYGLPIDQPALIEETVKLLKLLKAGERELKAMAAEAGYKEELNLASHAQIATVLFDLFKLPVTKRTPQGKPSSDKESLQELTHPFVDGLLHQRMIERLFTGYATKSIMLLKLDGRLHPSGSMSATTSGRLAYRDPPIQTLPKAHTVGAYESIRRIFSTESDDYVLVEADYKQIELFVAQTLSQDEQMGEDLASGDMHGVAAADFFHATNPHHPKDCTCSPECEAWNFARYSAKHYNFGSLFDMGPSGYTRKPPLGIGCSMQEAVRINNAWQKRYHETVAWKNSIRQEIKTKGYITTLFGRRRRMSMVLNQRQLRQIVNAPIQGTASDCTLSAAIELHAILKNYDSRILFLVHDSIVFHVAKRHYEIVKALILEIMQKPRHPRLPSLEVELTVGPNLFNMERA